MPKNLSELYLPEVYNTFVKQIENSHGKKFLDEFLEFHRYSVMLDILMVYPPPGIWELFNTYQRRKTLENQKKGKTIVHTYGDDGYTKEMY